MQRFSLEMALARETGGLRCAQADSGLHWLGLSVKLLDGTGTSVPDTPDNQARCSPPNGREPEVGFSLARLVGRICLSTSAVVDATIGPFKGKWYSAHGLIRRLLGAFCAGDVMLADTLFCSYWLIATLEAVGMDVLFEQHGSRRTDFRRGGLLGAAINS